MRPDVDAFRARCEAANEHDLLHDDWLNLVANLAADVPVLLDYIRELEDALREAVTLGEAASSRGLSDYGMTVDAFAEELAAWTRLRAVLGVCP